MSNDAEKQRLAEARSGEKAWKRWGPYLSERQWGTVREDYSDSGDAWNYFTHDQARSRAYRWGEDGLGGISDDQQRLCFALALWNGRDPILKERVFGLANGEGNHGEDAKECYFYLDSTPTHSYMKYLYKYPQAAFPYEQLVATNRRRGKHEPEFELLDTGVFRDDRYFDVFVEYAKGGPDDLLIRISVANRGPEAADLHLLPTLWFRNTWMWGGGAKPELTRVGIGPQSRVRARYGGGEGEAPLADYFLYCDGDAPLLFTENENNNARLFGTTNAGPHVKDAFHDFVVGGVVEAVNPAQVGTKAAAHYQVTIAPGATQVVRLRLTTNGPTAVHAPFADFDALFARRLQEADAFYASIMAPAVRDDAERAGVMRQALAGMLWSKQYYHYDLNRWLDEHDAGGRLPPHLRRSTATANGGTCGTATSSRCPTSGNTPGTPPGIWPFTPRRSPWWTWTSPSSSSQLMLRNDYLHPNGQLPAYEWNFGDVNPPVHAWATMNMYVLERESRGGERRSRVPQTGVLEAVAQFHLVGQSQGPHRRERLRGRLPRPRQHRSLRPFVAVAHRWASRPGRRDGLDGLLQPADAAHRRRARAARPGLRGVRRRSSSSTPCFIAGAMDRVGERHDEMWDEEDGFFYDVLRFPDGAATRLKVRSIVGLLPLAAVVVFEEDIFARLPTFAKSARRFLARHPDLIANLHLPGTPGVGNRRMLSIVDEGKLRRILARMLDEAEFFGPYGIRALSRYHLDHPYVFRHGGAGVSASPTSRATRTAACSVATRTGAGLSGCRSTLCSTALSCSSTPTSETSSRSSARRARDR